VTEADRASHGDEVVPADVRAAVEAVPEEIRREVVRLAAESHEWRTWAGDVRGVLSWFEASVAELGLTDEVHAAVGRAVGIELLYDLLDELAEATTPVPPPGR
jgi:hypothetical protein